MSTRPPKPPKSDRGGRGARGKAKKRRTEAPTPEVQEIDVFNTCLTWPKLSEKNVDHHLINHINDEPPLDIHFQTCGGARGGVYMAYTRLTANSRMRRVIEATNWHHVCEVNELRNDHKLIFALIERWWETTHTFHLPCMEIGFTPYDFTCITGMSVGIGVPLALDEFEGHKSAARKGEAKVKLFRRLFPFVPRSKECKWFDDENRGVNGSRLLKELGRWDIPEVHDDDGDELTPEEIYLLRMFFAYVIAQLWFPVSKGSCSFGYLHAIEDVENIGRYDWGSAILANLYYNLDRCSWMGLWSMQCCWFPLQYWYYEVFGSPSPRLIDPYSTYYPCIKRWAPERQMRSGEIEAVGDFGHNVVLYRARLEEATYQSVNSNPFQEDPLFNRREVVEAYSLSQRRTVIGGGEWFIWYCGERLWPQLNGRGQFFGIPHPPPKEMHVEEHFFREWTEAGRIPIEGHNVRAETTELNWLRYWKHASIGPILAPRYRTRNVEYMSPLPGQHLDLLGVRPPGPGMSSGPVPTYHQADLSQYYSPHDYTPVPGAEPIQFQPTPVHLPPLASNTAWRNFGSHEKGLVQAQRDHMTRERQDYEKLLRKQQKLQRRRERDQQLMNEVFSQFGHLIVGIDRQEDTPSNSSQDDDYRGDQTQGGEAGCSQDYDLGAP